MTVPVLRAANRNWARTGRWLGVFLFLGLSSGEAVAQSYSELAPQGYILFRRTHVVGVFDGCQKDLDIQFAEDTIFTCLEQNHHMAYAPPVVILRNGETNTYAV